MKKVAAVNIFAIIASLLAFLIVLPAAHADDLDQATKVTFSEPVQIPGHILPAGTYWFVLPENIAQHNQVRIFNSDRSTLYATVFTMDAVRPQPTDDTVFTFAENTSEQPEAIVTWFYPGSTTGHQFQYPKQEQEELARDNQVIIAAGD